LLRETILPALHMHKTQVARALDISRSQIYGILDESKPVSPEIAVKLGTAFGDGPDVWLRMQANYDAWHAARHTNVSKVKKLVAAER
jgi:addiction module HigA family antidote